MSHKHRYDQQQKATADSSSNPNAIDDKEANPANADKDSKKPTYKLSDIIAWLHKTRKDLGHMMTHDRLNTAFTFVIAAATVVYVIVAINQLGVMSKTLNLDRPWVGISGSGNFNMSVTINGPLIVALNAQNTGRSPALNLVTVNKMETVGPSGHPPNFGNYSKSEGNPPVVLFPGAITTIRLDTSKLSDEGNSLAHLQAPEVEALKNGTVQIYVYGSIWYDDTSHTEHRTDWCFTYIPDSQAVTVSNSFGACKTHNYAD